MTDLPLLTEDLIRAWTDGRSFSRGQDYARSDAIVNPRIQGTTLKAECWGSANEPYRVEVALGDAGIVFAVCTCPVSLHCKHAVAVLLTWLHHPERFHIEEDLRAALSRRNQEELVRIIFRIIDRHPDAAEIAVLPLPGESAGRPAVDGDAIRRQVRAITEHTPHSWGASYTAAAQVGRLLGPGDEYATAGDWANAAVFYATVADAILEDYNQIYEEEGEYLDVVRQCANGLTDCLSHTQNPDQRRYLLETLFRIWRWDIHFGGAGIYERPEAAMVSDTTADEKALLADWARAVLPSVDTDSLATRWRQEAIGGFLLQLEADILDDDAFLRICLETGRTRDLVARLLALKRSDEATDAAQQLASDYVLLGLADLFQDAGLEGIYAVLIRERIGHSRDTRLLEWLIACEMAGERFQSALEVARQLFVIRPSLEAYRKVRAPAQEIGVWETERAALLSGLTRANELDLRVRIFLDEGEIDRALEALTALKEQGRPHSYPTDLAVAKAAEATRPEAAIEIYLDAARTVIQQRNRGSYAEAAGYLTRVRDLLQKSGQLTRWTALIAQIRDENRRLRALRDELDRAGL
jgi:tetratricopeptide (TPR) repeat protein